jgi:SAM-dependent methyltransferase
MILSNSLAVLAGLISLSSCAGISNSEAVAGDTAVMSTTQFAGKVMGDVIGATILISARLGDELGLFKDLAERGPATSKELAERTKLKERYVREWLAQMASAKYLLYDPATQRFTLPKEYVPVLANEGGPHFVAGFFQATAGLANNYERLKVAFQKGGGVPMSAFPESYYAGMDRTKVVTFKHELVQKWIPSMPEVKAKLEAGKSMGDLGSGSGLMVIALAKAFPKASFVGYDIFAPAVEQATKNAKEAGVADRVSFRKVDVAKGLDATHDILSIVAVIHDAADPQGILDGAYRALNDDGIVFIREAGEGSLEDHINDPMAAAIYGLSLHHCLTQSLAEGGPGMGLLGATESKIRELAKKAGFSKVDVVPDEEPYSALYVLHK